MPDPETVRSAWRFALDRAILGRHLECVTLEAAMRDCTECGGPVEPRFHYCPWCSTPQRRKLVQFFRSHEALADDHGKALRVSRYFGATPEERHVRFSVWNDSGSAEAAVSLDEEEAQRLAGFIAAHGGAPPPRRRGLDGLLAQLRLR